MALRLFEQENIKVLAFISSFLKSKKHTDCTKRGSFKTKRSSVQHRLQAKQISSLSLSLSLSFPFSRSLSLLSYLPFYPLQGNEQFVTVKKEERERAENKDQQQS